MTEISNILKLHYRIIFQYENYVDELNISVSTDHSNFSHTHNKQF